VKYRLFVDLEAVDFLGSSKPTFPAAASKNTDSRKKEGKES
jgi:hypothetical protein